MEPIPEQPDNEIGFDLAGVGTRLGARSIDVLVGVATYVVVFVIVVATSDINLDVDADSIEIPDGAALILRWAPVAIWGLYEVLLTRSRGQTLGKMATRIKVINAAGEDRPPWGSAAIRWGVLVLPMTLIPDLIGLLISVAVGLWFVWDKKGQGLHDKAASTYVVRAGPARPPPG